MIKNKNKLSEKDIKRKLLIQLKNEEKLNKKVFYSNKSFIIGVILLIVSFITNPLFDCGLFLTIAGGIAIIIGFVIRNIWEKNR